MKSGLKLSLACLAAFWSCNAHAEMTANEFIAEFDRGPSRSALLSYIDGLESGYGWANTKMAVKNQTPTYCPPSTLALQNEQLVSILRIHLHEEPYEGEFPVGLALLTALIKTFPCK